MAAKEERASWGRHIEFIITCIGFAVGLGNIWRFPHLAYKNGGGAFLLPYVISLVFMGIPLFCLEILFGQFASLGPITIWEINLLFKGLGYTMVCLAAIISIYYNVVVATAIFYLFASMQSSLPWASCGNEWNTCSCRTSDMNRTLSDPLIWYDSRGLNCTDADPDKTKSASEEYYYNYVLEATDGIFDVGKLKWDLTLCNLLAWIIICVALIKSVQSMGKAVYFFALFPYVLMTVLLVRGATLEGAWRGIEFYLKPDVDKLLDSKVWKQAASQIFFSLSCCTGSLTAMSSYNKFNNNVLRDSLIIPIINCLTSLYAGFAIFSVLGFMAETAGTPVANVTTDGPGLVFVVYPEGLSNMPVPQLWSILFFFMMICLGFGTQFPSVETVLTALQDEFPALRGKRRSIVFRVTTCLIGFLLGLPLTTQGGSYLLDLCDIFVGFPLLLVGFFEVIAIVWVYGFHNFAEDVLLMVGDWYPTRVLFYAYYSWNWLVVTPVLIMAIVIFDCVTYEPIIDESYPEWAEVLGWLIVGFIMLWLPVWYIARYCYEMYTAPATESAWEVFVRMNRPTIKWGPHLPENRTLPRYLRLLEAENTVKLPYYEKGGAMKAEEGGGSTEKGQGSYPPVYNDAVKTGHINPEFEPDSAVENTHL
ncbi:sodium- and chloride-dependent neutral and basic amino acid transporter B(0+) [Aplysia californica]|uniref:Sodium- and chloride-dependent neutral and basic amino acid transporter B(0+) n=1 Tax=Aplysia californica TaxID=6500 RepID=A0ABM0JUT8_APLCA|nr:sodium- and chloride-dependent neutral and basic amino acid transporter B(0+) [Aplysia californica]